MIFLKEYDINLELILSTKFKQSGLNKNDVKEKIVKVIMNSLEESKSLKSLLEGEFPIIVFDINESKTKE